MKLQPNALRLGIEHAMSQEHPPDRQELHLMHSTIEMYEDDPDTYEDDAFRLAAYLGLKSFTILHTGGASDAKAEWEVHRTGCRDIERTLRRSPFVDIYPSVVAATAEQVVAAEVEVYTAQDQGWTAADHRILPCCRKN